MKVSFFSNWHHQPARCHSLLVNVFNRLLLTFFWLFFTILRNIVYMIRCCHLATTKRRQRSNLRPEERLRRLTSCRDGFCDCDFVFASFYRVTRWGEVCLCVCVFLGGVEIHWQKQKNLSNKLVWSSFYNFNCFCHIWTNLCVTLKQK